MVVGDISRKTEVAILGGGPAGYSAALRLVQGGKQVVLVEADQIGGTCLNRGCIPLKALGHWSKRLRDLKDPALSSMGLHVESVSYSLDNVKLWKEQIVQKLRQNVRKLLEGYGVEVVEARGWFLDAHTLRLELRDGLQRLHFQQAILAVGAQATLSEDLCARQDNVLTAEQLLRLDELPSEIAVLGDSYLALELSLILTTLGCRVAHYFAETPLRGLPRAQAEPLLTSFRRQVASFQQWKGSQTGKQCPLVITDHFQGNTAELGELTLPLSESFFLVDESCRLAGYAHLFAIGDCLGGENLLNAGLAFKQGKMVADLLLGKHAGDFSQVQAQVAVLDPPVATIGLSLEAARAQGEEILVGRFPLAAHSLGLIAGQKQGAMTLYARAKDGMIVGGTIVAPGAGELAALLTLAMEMGTTLTDLMEIRYLHPAFSELLLEGSEAAYGQAIHIFQPDGKK